MSLEVGSPTWRSIPQPSSLVFYGPKTTPPGGGWPGHYSSAVAQGHLIFDPVERSKADCLASHLSTIRAELAQRALGLRVRVQGFSWTM